MADQVLAQPVIEALLERGEDTGCLNLSEVDDLARKLEFEDEELDALHERIEARGIDLTDDCGRSDAVTRTEFKPEELATTTTDALQLFLNEIRRYPLLTASEEIELSKRHHRTVSIAARASTSGPDNGRISTTDPSRPTTMSRTITPCSFAERAASG